MTRGRLHANRVHVVQQAALVWIVIDEDTCGEHLSEFVESGSMDAEPQSIPYNPEIMAGIAQNWSA